MQLQLDSVTIYDERGEKVMRRGRPKECEAKLYEMQDGWVSEDARLTI